MQDRDYLLRDYNTFKRTGKHTLNLGNRHYDYLVLNEKIKVPHEDPSKGLEYAKEMIIEDYKVDLKIASSHMKDFWQQKIDNIDVTIEKALSRKENSFIKDKMYNNFKTYCVNEFFKNN